MSILRLLLAAALLFTLPGPAQAGCEHPQAATQNFLDHLQEGGDWNPVAASQCFPQSGGQDEEAVHLKQVLDARGLLIDFDTISTDPNYTDENGVNKQVLHKREPRVFLTKQGDQWLFSNTTVEAIPVMYVEAFSGLARSLRQTLPSAFHKPLVFGIQAWQIVFLGLLALVAILAGRIAHALLQNQVARVAKRFNVQLTEAVLSTMKGPLTWLAGGAVFLIGVPDLQLNARLSSGLNLMAQGILSIAIMLCFLRLTDIITDFWKVKAEETETKLDDQFIPLANRALKLVIWALGLLSILDNMGVDVTSLLAGVTISGLAIALAAKDTVENLFGSAMIFVDRPFQIDDYIEVGGVGGTVEEVGFRSTRLRTPIGSVVTIPNGSIASAKVDNMGLRTARRMRFQLGFTYSATREQIDSFCTQARGILEADERILDGHEVHLVNFGDSAIEVMIHAFVNNLGWSNDLAVNSEIRMQLWTLADELKLSFAFPSQSLYVESLPSTS
jgi:MscS family membrane protein